VKLRQEKRVMEALDTELQWFSKLQNPEWLDWAIENGKGSQDSGWRMVGRMASYIKEMNKCETKSPTEAHVA
jgi:hypothetical protein